MARTTFVSLAVLCSAANAFTGPLMPAPVGSARWTQCSTSRVPALMASKPDIVTMEDINKVANSCLESGCDVELVQELQEKLNKKQQDLQVQLQNVQALSSKLSAVLGGSDTKTPLEDLIKTIASAFKSGANDYPLLSTPSGFSGDIPKGGSKDAWDYGVTTSFKGPKKN